MKWWQRVATAVVAASLTAGAWAAGTPDGLIRQLSNDVMAAVKSDKALHDGDLKKIGALVDSTIMPHVDFERMTASAVGHYWNQANADQKSRLQDQFKNLLMRTYSGAVTRIRDQRIVFKPLRGDGGASEVVVQTLIVGGGDPMQMDYRLEKVGDDWKIYDVNVLGVWLVQNYRSQFAQEIDNGGIDGLLSKLEQHNKPGAGASSAEFKAPAARS